VISRQPGSENHPHVPDTFRVWRITTIYIAFAVTVVIVLLVIEAVHGPILHPPPAVCPR
jgi:hypothetical protein